MWRSAVATMSAVILPPKIQIIIEIDTAQMPSMAPATSMTDLELKITTNVNMTAFQFISVFYSAMGWAMQQAAAAAFGVRKVSS
jgi:hypothetical protein